MAPKHQKKSKKKTLVLFIAVIILIVTAIIFINKKLKENDASNNGTNTVSNTLKGTYRYTNLIKYVFGENNKGAMCNEDELYEFSYNVNGDTLKIDFVNDSIRDATYKFSTENDVLTLIGEEGTTGGKYLLKKEAE